MSSDAFLFTGLGSCTIIFVQLHRKAQWSGGGALWSKGRKRRLHHWSTRWKTPIFVPSWIIYYSSTPYGINHPKYLRCSKMKKSVIFNCLTEFCSSLVWILNSSSILQELSLTSIAVFAALTVRDDGPNVKKHHIKYHLTSLSVISACIGVTGVLNFEPEGCVFLAQDISPKYGLYFNGLRSILAVITLLR